MKKSCFMTMLCALLICIGLFSCEKDEVITEVPEPAPEEPTPEPEPAHYVDITYTLNCSEDLLKCDTSSNLYGRRRERGDGSDNRYGLDADK